MLKWVGYESHEALLCYSDFLVFEVCLYFQGLANFAATQAGLVTRAPTDTGSMSKAILSCPAGSADI